MERMRPSKKQQELLNYIDGFIKGHGYGPSYREVMRALNYKSVSTVAIHINELIAKGYLIKRERSARSLEVVDGAKTESSVKNNVSTHSEVWLIENIEKKFKAAEAKMTQKVVDDLYVLVGALHVLGLRSEHESFKQRLLALDREKPI
jgi:repressor LexA